MRVRAAVGHFTLDVSLDIPPFGVTGVFGPSGCGKTTLLRCVAGLHRASTGSIRWGEEVWQDADQFVPPHARGVGYVSQHADLFPHMSVLENLEYGAKRAPPGERRVARDDVVRWLELEPLLSRGVGRLSGGERQRAAMGRALLAEPRILLLDEPLSALDEPARRDVLRHLEPILARIDFPVVFVSHAVQEVSRLADHFVWLRNGRVADAGPVTRIVGGLEFAQWLGDERGVVLDGEVASHDVEYDLSVVTTALGAVTVPRRPEALGTRVRVQIKARDVSLGLAPQDSSSILNELPLHVLEMADLSSSDCLVRLGRVEVDDAVLLAKITRKSRVQLGLQPQSSVFARVKSVAVLD